MTAAQTRYATIVADPPWEQPRGGPHNGSDGRVRRGPPSALPYPTMLLAEIEDLPVRSLAARDAHLWLWVTNAYLQHGWTIARKWGFSPTVVLTWCKQPRGLGLGGTFTQTTEYVIFARRGSLRSLRRLNTTWFAWPRGAHSAKPEAFFDLVESVSPGPYLEMFARRQRLGWDTWGNEALEHVEVAV